MLAMLGEQPDATPPGGAELRTRAACLCRPHERDHARGPARAIAATHGIARVRPCVTHTLAVAQRSGSARAEGTLFHGHLNTACIQQWLPSASMRKAELANVNPSRGRGFTPSARPATPAAARAFFQGHVDLADRALYSAAVARFQQDILKYNVNRAGCSVLCGE